MTIYQDRAAAGLALVGDLRHLIDRDAVVVGIPRGGVEVAAPIAEALGVRLGVIHAVKVGSPRSRELGIGAVTADGVATIDEDMARRVGATQADIDGTVGAALAEIRRREQVFGTAPAVEGRLVLVVDDGVATGSTLRAALDYARRQGAARVVCAIPVGAASSVARLGDHADEVVCPLVPDDFRAVGEWYRDFGQTSDERVRELLGRS